MYEATMRILIGGAPVAITAKGEELGHLLAEVRQILARVEATGDMDIEGSEVGPRRLYRDVVDPRKVYCSGSPEIVSAIGSDKQVTGRVDGPEDPGVEWIDYQGQRYARRSGAYRKGEPETYWYSRKLPAMENIDTGVVEEEVYAKLV